MKKDKPYNCKDCEFYLDGFLYCEKDHIIWPCCFERCEEFKPKMNKDERSVRV